MNYTRWYITETFDNTENVSPKLRGITRDRTWKHTKEECEEVIKRWFLIDSYSIKNRTFNIELRIVWKPGTKKTE